MQLFKKTGFPIKDFGNDGLKKDFLRVCQYWHLAVQIFAILGGGAWISTIVEIVKGRIAIGEPWGKMAMILGAVALFTISAGLLLNSSKVKEKYPPKQ